MLGKPRRKAVWGGREIAFDEFSRGVLRLVSLFLATFLTPAGATVEITLLDTATVPNGTTVGGVIVRDLSAIRYESASGRFLAVNDSGGSGAARGFELGLPLDASGFGIPAPLDSDRLRREDGSPLPNVDAEGLGIGTGGGRFVSTEGRGGTDLPESRDPRVRAFDRTTLRRVAELPVPGKFNPQDATGNPVRPGSGNQAVGVQRNLGFEALAVSADGERVIVANEAALFQDDSRTPFDSEFNQAEGPDSRILLFVRNPAGDWRADTEKVYRAERGTDFIFLRLFNTVVSVLTIDHHGRMLVMERGLTAANLDTGSYRIRIYEIDYEQENATDVAPYSSLRDLPAPLVTTRLEKCLVWESFSGLDNLEGMTWGPPINGFRSLILVSDNNSSSGQITQFLLFTTNVPHLPETVFLNWMRGFFSEAELVDGGLDDPLGGWKVGYPCQAVANLWL